MLFVKHAQSNGHSGLSLQLHAAWEDVFSGVKVDFHSVENVARSIFSERCLVKCVKSTTANEICSA